MQKLKRKLYVIIFEADTPAGKLFDLILLALILISVLVVMLESVKSLNEKYGDFFEKTEFIISALFTVEYFLRIWISENTKKYVFSFYGIIDFLAILPFYLSFFVSSPSALLMVRTMRLLRLFKVAGLSKYQTESIRLLSAIKASRARISVFLYVVLIIVVLLGTVMYIVEGEQNGFTSIPRSIYWAIVTITTVGYGDIAPQTTVGQFIAGLLMIIGYSIIAVPTGIVTAEMVKKQPEKTGTKQKAVKKCPSCGYEESDPEAKYCKICGTKLIDDD